MNRSKAGTMGIMLLAASLIAPLWLASALSRTFVDDLGPVAVGLTQGAIVALLGYCAALLCFMISVRRGSRIARWWLLALIAFGSALAVGGLWLLFSVGPALKAGSAIMVGLQVVGAWLLLRRRPADHRPGV